MQHTTPEQFSLVLPHKHYDPDHLTAVTAEMRTLGAPIIRAVCADGDGLYVALEGSHRIRAASALGLVPTIDLIEYGDYAIDGCDGGRGYTVAEIVDDAAYDAVVIEFGGEHD